MPITYHPTLPRGNQWTIIDNDGRKHADLPACAVRGLLSQRGMSVRRIEAVMADARLQAATT